LDNYKADFLKGKKDSKTPIYEREAKTFRNELKEKDIKEIEGLNPDRLKYEILITNRDEIGFENISKINEEIYGYWEKNAGK